MAKYSVIIKNGTVFDGTGKKPERIDIGVKDDQIKRLGDLQKETADMVIDASGKYVSPGFVDITNHSDTHWSLFSQPNQESMITQGVTTAIGGSCGLSLAPFTGSFSKKEIGRWVDMSQVNISWQTMGEFLDVLERRALGLNFGSFAGLDTIISSFKSGDDFSKKIKFLMESSLKDGAIGISFNFGISLQKKLNNDEIIELFNFLSKAKVVSKIHLENEGKDVLPAISDLLNIARKTGARMHISHLRAIGKGAWVYLKPALDMIRRANEEGLSITCDFFPYTRTGSSLFELLPSWIRKFSTEELKDIFSTKKGDSRLEDVKEYLKQITLHYDKIIIATADKEYGIVGKNLKQLAEEAGKSGEEIILDVLKANDMRVSIFNDVISEKNIAEIAMEKFSAISSDGVGYSVKNENKNDLPHPRSFGAFPKFFDIFARGIKILSWEEAVYKMTGLPAKIIELTDRGLIKKGYKADLVVFDPNTIASMSSYEDPCKYSVGVEHVFVNGKAAVSDSKPSGVLSGKVLRRRS
ncbi:MAG: amidohydrolase family protein [bacterium]|nr:amidohydrolase family protein [bacterium]